MNYNELFRESLHGNKLEVFLTLNCYNGQFKYKKNIRDDEEYLLLKTATSTMAMDKYTGNILELKKDRARILIKMGDQVLDLQNVRILEELGFNDRVLLSEHLDVNGNLEWIATRKPLKTGDLNFLTIAMRNRKTKIFNSKLRIDIITGETKEEITNGFRNI